MSYEEKKFFFTINVISALALAIGGVLYLLEDGFTSSDTIVSMVLCIPYAFMALRLYVKYKVKSNIEHRRMPW